MDRATLETVTSKPRVTSARKQNLAATRELIRKIKKQLKVNGPDPGDLKSLSVLLKDHSKVAYEQHLTLV